MSITKKVKLFKKQIEFIVLQCAVALFDAGIGTGKTTILGFWLGCMVQKYPGTKWILAARDLKQLRNATSVEFEWALANWLGLEEDIHYTKKWSPQLTYVFYNGSIVHGFGAHNYDTVFRGGNYSGMAADEVDYWKPDAWSAAKGRIRRYPEFIRAVSSPKGYNHIWEDFYKHKIGPVINASTYDNPTLSKGYIERLKKTYSPRLFEQEVMGKRLRLNVGAVYSEFNEKNHTRDLTDLIDDIIDNRREIYFFTDYNIANYCGVYLYFDGITVYCIGEEHLQYKGSKWMALEVSTRFPHNPIIVCGDSTGNNKKDVAIEFTNYAHFEAAGLMTKPFFNPPVHSRIISANSNLYHG